MSRITEIVLAEQSVVSAEDDLSNLIHKIFHSDRVIWYQTGMSEHPSSWQEHTVVGPYNKFQFTIRPVGGGPSLTVDGRSYRLRTDWKDYNNIELHG